MEDEVGVGLPVDVHGVKVVGLDHVDSDKNVKGIVGWKALLKRKELFEGKIIDYLS